MSFNREPTRPSGAAKPWRRALLATAAALLPAALPPAAASAQPAATLLPNGQTITPTAAPGSSLRTLNPHLAAWPTWRPGQALNTALSPDGNTLLVLTSGYNLLNTPAGRQNAGKPDPTGSKEYVFVYDVSGALARAPKQRQVLQIPNAFYGLAWAPDGRAFYASGGGSDAVFKFTNETGAWAQQAAISLNHGPYADNLTGSAKLLGAFLGNGIGFQEKAVTGGIAVSADGGTVLVANTYNESVSVIDAVSNTVRWEYDLRPYRNTPALDGTPGGEEPFAVAIAASPTGGLIGIAGSVRDRELVVFPLGATPPDLGTLTRIKLPGTPLGMVLAQDGRTLYVAQDNADSVAIVDLITRAVTGAIDPAGAPGFPLNRRYRGLTPNNVALSPDGRTLYVTDGGANAVSIVDLTQSPPVTRGLVPTGWYPHAVAVSRKGGTLYVVNGRSNPMPNPRQPQPGFNQYVLQLEQAGLLAMPVPGADTLPALTAQVAHNNQYDQVEPDATRNLMITLRDHIKHVIYVIKENRTFDQILGDLNNGSNGDPKIAMYGKGITPNLHQIARNTVTLDNFYAAGEVSADGWPWATGGRESDIGVKTVPLNYANRGGNDDSAGLNRVVNVGYATLDDRVANFPSVDAFGGSLYLTLANAFPGGAANLLPGTANDFATDGPVGTLPERGFLWDSALRAGLTIRNYGFMVDLVRYFIPTFVGGLPTIENPAATGTRQAWAAIGALQPVTDIYFRGFDNAYPDVWRMEEWYREFQQYEANGNLPHLTLLRLMHDHTGQFCPAPYTDPACPAAGLNTPEMQEADNDYAVGKLAEIVSGSRYANDTMIFIIEDDAQDGPDHVNPHRSTAYVLGPYVKRGKIVSTHYSTVNMIRTIEDVLDVDHLSVNDANQLPMADIFSPIARPWRFRAVASPLLKDTGLVGKPNNTPVNAAAFAEGPTRTVRSGDWWARHTKGFDWSAEDRVPGAIYSRIEWEGMKPGQPYPVPQSTEGADADDK